MTGGDRHEVIRRALDRVVKRTPLSFFERLIPETDTASERFNAHLDDGSEVVFECRTTALQRTDALRRRKDGANEALPDGEYRLREGPAFRVSDGRIDFDALFADPDGVEPFRQYGAWREVVAIENALLSLPDPAEITDVIRFVAPDGNSYYAVQRGADQPFQAFVAKGRQLESLEDGEFPLPGGRSFSVKAGEVSADSLADVKVCAFDSTRLPE
jgi:hypothetical protein